MSKKKATLYVDEDVVKKAKEADLNLSEITEDAIKSQLFPYLSAGERITADFEEHLEDLKEQGKCFKLPFRIKGIHLKNVGPISELDADFGDFNVVLGRGASGKTTLIRSIVHACMPDESEMKDILKEGEEEGEISVDVPRGEGMAVEFNKEGGEIKEEREEGCLLIDDPAPALSESSFEKFLDYLKDREEQIIMTSRRLDYTFDESVNKTELKIELEEEEKKALVIGVGGSGCNDVDQLCRELNSDFCVINTDGADLKHVGGDVDQKMLIGSEITQGLGAGARPELGRKAAESAEEEIAELVEEYDQIYLVSGLGGGTGSGAVPVIARICEEKGKDVEAFVTLPFDMEGEERKRNAENSLDELEEICEVNVFPLQNIVQEFGDVSLQKGFRKVRGKMKEEMDLPKKTEAERLQMRKEKLKEKLAELEERKSELQDEISQIDEKIGD